MKKIFLSLTFLAAVSLCKAQDHKLEIGIELGPSAASQTGGYLAGNSSAFLAYSAGITAQYNITTKFSLKSGIGFEQKGHYTNTIITDSTGRPTSNSIIENDLFDYIVLPILARYNFPGSANFFINAGPYFGYLLNETDYISMTNNKNPASSTDNTNLDNRIDAGAVLGLGIGKQVSEKFRIEMEIRGNIGLTTVVPPNQAFSAGVYNQSVNLLFGLKYAL